jgi:hypothetical protein
VTVALNRTPVRAGLALIALLMASPIGFCQTYPGQYPSGQYPGQYPSQYPPGTVPMQLPGGIPVAVPPLQLPKRGSKDAKQGDTAKVALLGVGGTLRELREKDLFLDTGKQRLLRFRMLAKTEFRNKAGEPVRDSLLKPGDQLEVQANKIDPETAVRVVLIRAGTPAERTAAELPFDHDSAHTPVEADMRPAGTMDAPTGSPAEPPPATDSAPPPHRPDLEREEGNRPPAAPGAGSNPADPVIGAARRAAEAFLEQIPNFVVHQLTTRYRSFSNGAQWRADGVVTADVICVDDREEYRNILVDGRPSPNPVEKTGAWSTGEFVTTLRDVLSPETDAAFVRSGDDRIVGRDAYRYNYTVRKANSHWQIVNPDGRSVSPGYHGTVWIDKDSRRVLRLEMGTTDFPAGFTYDKAESTLDYDFVRIGSGSFLLPVKSANLACMSGTASCMKNEIDFRNYRKFTAESEVTFGK